MLKAVLIGLLIILIGAMIITPFGPANVISGSMEPEISVGSTVFIFPSAEVYRGDVIVFNPVELGQEMIVHRVVEETPAGFITRGDAEVLADQERGEPPVTVDRIVGTVLSYNGNILQVKHETFINLIMALCLVMGFLWVASDMGSRKKRIRVRHVQFFAIITCAVFVILTMIMGAGAENFSYLVIDNPGTLNTHVKLGEPGEIDIDGRNRSLIPVMVYVRGPEGSKSSIVMPFTDFETTVDVPARYETGLREINVYKYVYPLVMPPVLIGLFYNISPYVAMIVVAGVFLCGVGLLLRTMEPWVPLSKLGGKHITRYYRRLKRSLI